MGIVYESNRTALASSIISASGLSAASVIYFVQYAIDLNVSDSSGDMTSAYFINSPVSLPNDVNYINFSFPLTDDGSTGYSHSISISIFNTQLIKVGESGTLHYTGVCNLKYSGSCMINNISAPREASSISAGELPGYEKTFTYNFQQGSITFSNLSFTVTHFTGSSLKSTYYGILPFIAF